MEHFSLEKMKRYPKLASASLVLLLVTLVMLFTNWISMNQTSYLSILGSAIPQLQDGGISFADGRVIIGKLTQLNSNLSVFTGNSENTITTILTIANIIYQVMFFGTFAAVAYCIYARLKWESGLREGIYFLVFLADFGIMFFMTYMLNQLCGAGTFKINLWGVATIICALLSEIFWEEASFNTPNPLADINEKPIQSV